MTFRLKDGTVFTKEMNNSVLNELMFSVMAQNAMNNPAIKKDKRTANLKIEDLRSVEIVF